MFLTDAWPPQLNGVAIGSQAHVERLRAAGHKVEVVSPERFRGMPCPTYPELQLSFLLPRTVEALVDEFEPDCIHVNTEGPIGLAGVLACRKRGLGFTTSFRSRFPEYLNIRFRAPLGWTYGFLRWFHNSGDGCLVPTESLRAELVSRGFEDVRIWGRGVDAERFRPDAGPTLALPGPIFLYVGRLAVEKNVEAFLSLSLPGTKVVVGDGPQRAELERKFPSAHFLGARFGNDLPAIYASADVFVFPSRTDTFGNVILEALASGVPVAAFPVMGPKDIITDPRVGRMNEDLRQAALDALALDRRQCRAFALIYGWDASVAQFVSHLRLAKGGSLAQASAA